MSLLAITSVIRASQRGQRHGAVYLLDTQAGAAAHVLDWSFPGIDWSGAGGQRGLRGISVVGQRVFVAAADRLLEFSPEFELQAQHRCSYLQHAQAVTCHESRLYLLSPGYDAVLAFDLEVNKFIWGLHLHDDHAGLRAMPFDPGGALGPPPQNSLRLQSISADSRGLFIGGLKTFGLLRFDGKSIKRLVSLPEETRDARPWRDGVLFNDTAAGVSRFLTPEQNRVFPVLPYPDEVGNATPDPLVARVGFLRGLCPMEGGLFAAGSAPLTVTLHDIDSMKSVQRFCLDEDPCHAVHSIAPWPFATQK